MINQKIPSSLVNNFVVLHQSDELVCPKRAIHSFLALMTVGSNKILRRKMKKISFLSSSRNFYGLVKKDSLRTFPNCMNFIIKHRQREEKNLEWMKNILEDLMRNPRPDQFGILVNGFAAYYHLTICLFNYDNHGFVDTSQCTRYSGGSMEQKRMENYPDMTFILCEPGNSYFSSLFIINDRNIPQTCFRYDDKNIWKHLCQLLENENGWKNQIELVLKTNRICFLFLCRKYKIG